MSDREGLLSGSPRSGNASPHGNQLTSGMTFLSPRLSMMLAGAAAADSDPTLPPPPLTSRGGKKSAAAAKRERWAPELRREDSFTNPDSTGDESMGGGSNEEGRELDLLRLVAKAWETKMIGLALRNKEKTLDLTYVPFDQT
jgi:hypothetical protein